MRYYVLDRGDQLSVELSEKFHQLAAKQGLQLDAESPDIVVSIGGDGTMLHAFHTFIDRIPSISFVGVHTGHLGFFADWQANEIPELVDMITRHKDESLLKPRIVHYPLIELEIQKKSGTSSYICLNEFTLKGVDGTIVAQVDINDQMFEMFRETGFASLRLPAARLIIRAWAEPSSIPRSKPCKFPKSPRSTTGFSGRSGLPWCCRSIIIAIFIRGRNRICCLLWIILITRSATLSPFAAKSRSRASASYAIVLFLSGTASATPSSDKILLIGALPPVNGCCRNIRFPI